MARKKKEEVLEEKAEETQERVTDRLVNIKLGCHTITLVERTIHCPNGVACVTADEKAQIEAMGLIAE